MRTLLVGTMASVAMLIGFASSANASATVDLLWNNTTATLVKAPGASSTLITLVVKLTAGPAGVSGYTFTISYDPSKLQVVGTSQTAVGGNPNFGSSPGGAAVDNGTSLSSFSGLAVPPFGLGTGLNAGNMAILGTVTFHQIAQGPGSYSINGGIVVALDAFADQSGQNITGVTFNHATVVAVPEPTTVALLGLGLSGLALAGRRRRS